MLHVQLKDADEARWGIKNKIVGLSEEYSARYFVNTAAVLRFWCIPSWRFFYRAIYSAKGLAKRDSGVTADCDKYALCYKFTVYMYTYI
jgi:hypothetical protein